MPTIFHYIKQLAAFDPETLSIMGAAYENALRTLPASPPKNVREEIATRIIDSARAGERDPDKLYQIAISTLRLGVAQ